MKPKFRVEIVMGRFKVFDGNLFVGTLSYNTENVINWNGSKYLFQTPYSSEDGKSYLVYEVTNGKKLEVSEVD